VSSVDIDISSVSRDGGRSCRL